jgi:SAM-dependent methyltransferase
VTATGNWYAMDADAVLEAWLDRTGEFSPGYYAYYGPDEVSEALLSVVDARAGEAPTVLEVGCSSGRHLAHLLDSGYDDLHGVEINEEARAVMADAYPALSAGGEFRFAAIEDVVEAFDDRQFDVVYSVQTLQHVHPDAEWVFDELARVTDDLLVTVEIEGDQEASDVSYDNGEFPLYYRDWRAVFEDAGLRQVEALPVDGNTMRVFQRPSD